MLIQDERLFVKTAGYPDDLEPYLNHRDRVAQLRNAAVLAREYITPALPCLRHVVESPAGSWLIYDWAEGRLVRPCLAEVRSLPAGEVQAMLRTIYEIHRDLAILAWIPCDFYDGCMIYDFTEKVLKLIDLDQYHHGPFLNEMGRMFGSSRFMSPEEYERGVTIDGRTCVFVMGRTAAVLLSDNSLERAPFRGSDHQFEVMCRACRPDPGERFQHMEAFFRAWMT